jgi:hypothetical protein
MRPSLGGNGSCSCICCGVRACCPQTAVYQQLFSGAAGVILRHTMMPAAVAFAWAEGRAHGRWQQTLRWLVSGLYATDCHSTVMGWYLGRCGRGGGANTDIGCMHATQAVVVERPEQYCCGLQCRLNLL